MNPFLDRDLFEDELFSDFEWPKADFTGKEFVRCTFRKLLLPEANWQDARLDDCVFDGCDLTRMRPVKLAARGVAFINCRLMGIDWTELRPTPTLSFEACNLQYASFVNVNLTATRFAHCRLTEVNFFDSQLAGADFTDSEMSGSRIEHCDARKANFAGAKGIYVDPTKNKVKDARIGLATAILLAQSFGLRVDGYDDD
jgi:uncharacterized protein YjbI with pentapeptide repeats